MQVRTLENTTLEEITATFNEAFCDYFIPLRFTPESMALKMQTEGIQLARSIGVFAAGKLVGFILHGLDAVDGVHTAYNAGTGVIPPYRGQGLTAAMYRYAIPLLKEAGIYQHLLEVIVGNAPAINVYRAAGFQAVRELAAFQSTTLPAGGAPVAIRTIDTLPCDPAFAGMKPAWQNTTAAVNRAKAAHHLIGAFENETLVGYAAYVPEAGRVKQFAVHAGYRRQGIGTALFRHMLQGSAGGSLLVTNIEEACTPAVSFLERLRFQKRLGLYEMKLLLD